MSYYILPKINNQVVIHPLKTDKDKIEPYISHSIFNYVNSIKNQINLNLLNNNDITYDEIVKCINPYEYIFSKIPDSKFSVSKLKPSSNLFYDLLEIYNAINLFDLYNEIEINSLYISENSSDPIECFELLRENYSDNITTYCGFTNEVFELDKKFNFLVFEQKFNDLNSYFVFLANCLCAIIKCQIKNGSCIIKIDNTVYKPVVDFMYILSSLYDRVYILKPNSCNITTYEKYIICKNFHCKTDFNNINFQNLQELNNNTTANEIVSSFLNYNLPYYFISKIEDINVIISYPQIETLDIISNILKNKNREEKIENIKKNNIAKSVAWCDKYKIPCNKFTEKVNIFLPLVNKKEENIKYNDFNEKDKNEENIVLSSEI